MGREEREFYDIILGKRDGEEEEGEDRLKSAMGIKSFCHDNRKYFYFTTLVITRKDVQEYMKHHPEYKKANRFKDIICKIYI